MAKKPRQLHAEENPNFERYVAIAKSRERRLKQMDSYIAEELKVVAPEDANKYFIGHKPIARTSNLPAALRGGGYPILPAHYPLYYSFYLVSKGNDKKTAEIMQIAPFGADEKAEHIKRSGAFGRLSLTIPEAIKYLQSKSSERPGRKAHKSKLERSLAVISGICIIGAIFFLSSNVTGKAVAHINKAPSNLLGTGLVIGGLVAGFLWVKRRS